MRWNRVLAGLVVVAVVGAAAWIGWRHIGRGPDAVAYIENGRASWYGPGFHGRKTASGSRFNQYGLTAAHRKLPLGAQVTVTNKRNGKSVVVVINDRGPYVRGRHIDLSKAAARKLDVLEDGTVPVRIEATADQLDPDGDGTPGAK